MISNTNVQAIRRLLRSLNPYDTFFYNQDAPTGQMVRSLNIPGCMPSPKSLRRTFALKCHSSAFATSPQFALECHSSALPLRRTSHWNATPPLFPLRRSFALRTHIVYARPLLTNSTLIGKIAEEIFVGYQFLPSGTTINKPSSSPKARKDSRGGCFLKLERS